MSKKRLGRGLDALLSADRPVERKVRADGADGQAPDEAGGGSDLTRLAIADVVRSRYQPRREFDEGALEELAASIRAQGLLQPVLVRPRAQGGYELIAGERRWRASQLAGLTQIPAVIREASDEEVSAMALIENIQREDLNPLEEAQALERLKEEFGLTQQQVADAVGKSRVAVTNLLRLLNLAPPVRDMLLAREIEMGHARALLSLEPLDQERVARVVATKQLSVRQTEQLVRSRQEPQAPKPAAKPKDPDIARLERDLSDKVGAPVTIRAEGTAGAGALVIRYSTLDELEGILSHLR